MRHTVLVLIREPILQDKSEMEGWFGGEGDEGGGIGEEGKERVRNRERGTAGC